MSLVDLFSALADPTRCRVVEMLHERSRPVHELAAAFDISRPAISRHLKVLKDAGLVVEEKSGRENVYSLQRTRLKPMQDWLEKHRAAATKKAKAKVKVAAEAIDLPPAVEIAPAPEPIVAAPIPGPASAAPEPMAVEPAAKPKRSPKTPRPAAVAPPPAAAPQLSFFDL